MSQYKYKYDDKFLNYYANTKEKGFKRQIFLSTKL